MSGTQNINLPASCTQAAFCELFIVMPCLNEAETLACCINNAQNFLQRS